jgi:hypothetical protein
MLTARKRGPTKALHAADALRAKKPVQGEAAIDAAEAKRA